MFNQFYPFQPIQFMDGALTPPFGFTSVAANFPTVAATNTSTTGGSPSPSPTVALPASISAGDLLIILAASATDVVTPPSGFTQLFTNNVAIARPGLWYYGWYKVATGSEGASIGFTTGNGNSSHTSYRITGYQGTPEALTATGQSGTPNPPSLSPSWGSNKTLWISGVGLRSGSTPTISSAPSSYTNLIQRVSAGGTAANQIKAGSAQRELLTGTEDPGTFTLSASTEDWVTATIAIRPA